MANAAKEFPNTQGGGVLDFSPALIPSRCQEVRLREPFVLKRKDYNRIFYYGSGIKHLFISMSYGGANVELSGFEGLSEPCVGPRSL